jgi:hypothetical protein
MQTLNVNQSKDWKKVIHRHEKIDPRFVAWLWHHGCPFILYRFQKPRMYGHESWQSPLMRILFAANLLRFISFL